MDIAELNARDDERLRQRIDHTLVAIAAPAGFAFGFLTFASAMWANIIADGAVDPTASEVLGEMFLGLVLFGAPAVVISLIAWRRQLSSARLIVAASAALPMSMFTSLYGLEVSLRLQGCRLLRGLGITGVGWFPHQTAQCCWPGSCS